MSRKKAEKEEAALLKMRGKFPPELLKWVSNPEREITQEMDRYLDIVMKDRRRRIEIYLTALARKYVERSVYFVGRLPDLEEELLDPDRIKTMKTSDLIRLMGVMAEQVKDASEFLRNFVSDDDLMSEPMPTPGAEFASGEKEVEVEEVSEGEREAAAALPAESRQRIGGILKKMLMAMDSADKIKSAPVLTASAGDGKNDTKKDDTKKRSKKAKGKR